MRQGIRHTLVRRRQLWNGNIEPPLWAILAEPEHIVRWAWNTHHKTATRVAKLLRQRPGLNVVQLRSRNEATHWLHGPLQHSTTA